MIVPMKKVCLVVQSSIHNEALLKLREVGAVHLSVKSHDAPDNVTRSVERKAKVESAISLLGEVKAPKKKKSLVPAGIHAPRRAGARRGRRTTDFYGTEEQEPYSLDAVCSSSRPPLPDYIIGISRERKSLQDRVSFLQREISRLELWGDFDPESVRELDKLGLPVYLYEISYDVYKSIVSGDTEDIKFITVKKTKKSVFIVVLEKELTFNGTSYSSLILPEKNITVMSREIDEIKLEMDELDSKMKNLVDRLPNLKNEMRIAQEELEFENAVAGLENVQDVPQNMGICYLTGYLPKDEIENLKKAAAQNGWALSLTDPDEDDENVPTKIKNNRFVNLLNPVTDFLGITPGYREVDISPWFLIFFCLFFGMIFGDAGYGIILTLTAIFGIIATAGKGTPIALKMLLLLGLVNTLWGVATCSWFGVDSTLVPQVLKDISLGFVSSAKTDQLIVDKNLQFFCFAIGLVHMTIAHIKGFFRNIKSLKAFGEIGAIAMLWGMFNLILFLVVSPDYMIYPINITIYLIGGGFGLSFIFASYEGSIGRSILDSCKNIISVILNIANIFSDIMSYIRLWAVGLAGASIANTVNTMAGPMLGNFLIFAGIILLVFGHGLNLILNVLSVLVHGVRLNTLEFSSHIGLTWSGTAYKPFAQRGK